VSLVVNARCNWTGRQVRGDEKAWAHAIERHPELNVTGMPEDIQKTIESPDIITDAAAPNQKMAYYAPAPFGFRKNEMLKVVVKLETHGARFMSGHIVTAVKPNENVLWRRTG
jgi:hypothetical protein